MSGEILHLARVTLKALSPISLGSGEPSSLSDVLLFRDANGLPALPGSSLQGALRHLWAEVGGADDAALFGYEQEQNRNGQAGRLIFGFGAVHDSHDKAVVGRIMPGEIEADTVLRCLIAYTPVRRHHVKLNESHVADDRAKFDRAAVPAGTRFSFEIAMWGKSSAAETDKAKLEQVLAMLRHPAFRLGGAGRRGYGQIKLVRASYACPDLGDPEELRRIRGEPPSVPLAEPLDLSSASDLRVARAQLKLRPIGPWRVGTDDPQLREGEPDPRGRPPAITAGTIGIKYLRQPGEYRVCNGNRIADRFGSSPEKKPADIRILGEPRIVWQQRDGAEIGAVEEAHPGARPASFIVPGSAVRGPLVHRMLFHWNRIREHFIDADAADARQALETWKSAPGEFAELLGAAKERTRSARARGESTAGRQGQTKGFASRLYVNDGVAEGAHAVQALTHNVIDRFTGGVMNRLLYTEEAVLGGEITIELTILPRLDGKDWDHDVVAALVAALRDLCGGRLAIGAKSHGFCTGTAEWWGAGPWAARWQATGGSAQ